MLTKLRAVRMVRGVEQREIARLARIDNGRLCNLELGKTWVKEDARERIAEVFSLPVDLLFDPVGRAVPVQERELIQA